MQTQSSQTGSIEIPSSALAVFLCITFAITWGLVGVYIMNPEWSVAKFGEISGSHPFFFLSASSPAIASFTVVCFCAGFFGLRAFVARLMMWRGSLGWAVFILLLLPLVFVVGSLIKGGPVLAPLPPEGVGPVVAVLVMMLFLGPIEEFGWRGVMQPLLQRM